MERKLIAALACRNNGSRLYGKPVQNLDVQSQYSVLDNIIQCLLSVSEIDSVVLGISKGLENTIFMDYALKYGLTYIVGDEVDVLSRLIQCCDEVDGSDIFRVTTESPFMNFEMVPEAWSLHLSNDSDAVFLDDVIDGCGFEIISLDALKKSHDRGDTRHRSEMCTLYMRQHVDEFNILRLAAPTSLVRKDIRLTIDNPEDLVICRHIFNEFSSKAPNIPLDDIVTFLDKNPHLIALVAPYVDEGYSTMYHWSA